MSRVAPHDPVSPPRLGWWLGLVVLTGLCGWVAWPLMGSAGFFVVVGLGCWVVAVGLLLVGDWLDEFGETS